MSSQVGIPADLTVSEVDRLRKSAEEFSHQANSQTKQMLRLTRILAWLTAIMTLLVCTQLYLAITR